MTDQIRENSKWFKEKGAVIREYVKGHIAAFSAVAGRGFLLMPGFLYDVENEIETDSKRKLSDVNDAILQDTIERELKQTGLTYDISYKNLLYAWELRKQELLTDWDAELAGIKQDMAGKEEAIARLEIETASRGTILLEAKTEIELEAESLKNQIAGLEDDTADYAVTLANQKLLTAQKKLEIIPILEQIVTKEQELLEAERLKIPEEQALLATIQETTAKKEELVPYLANLINATDEYSAEIANQLLIEQSIAEQRVLGAGITLQKAEQHTLIAGIAEQKAAQREELAAIELEKAGVLLDVAAIHEDKAAKQGEIAGYTIQIAEQKLIATGYATARADELVAITATKELQAEERTEIAIEEGGKSAYRLSIAEIMQSEAEVHTAVAHARGSVEEKNLSLVEAKISTEDSGHRVDENIMAQQTSVQTTMNTALTTTAATINAADKATNDYSVSIKEQMITLNTDTRVTAASTRSELSASQINDQTRYKTQEIQQIATLEQQSKVTASLTHLLSM